ncbi:outer membrane protein assembly factor BamE [Aquisphaera insulae]|uniref:outer membrane protein assembly factor BamE n=1 Tax=Aquisphaera insulae TaxID=2712864 RepID=UPI0013EADA68|nr:outer membrane protein assembly factor BamE [Aquisphaera insulae]
MARWLAMLRAWSRSPGGGRLLAFGEALAAGLAIGIAVTFSSLNHPNWRHSAYLLAGFLLGLRHAGRAVFCWLPLGVSLYVAHVVAIILGVGPPHVEANTRMAEVRLFALIPAGVGLMAGALLRTILEACDSRDREHGPSVRFLPRTSRDLLVLVACLGIGFGLLHRAAHPPTLYARGFTEADFRRIRNGMTAEQVLAILGPPLRKLPWGNGSEAWLYSNKYHRLANFHRRWLFLRDGVVESIVHDDWAVESILDDDWEE